jgi:hypothetical protein
VNIFEISDRHGISVKKLRALDKDGVLRHDASTTPLDEIRATLKTGNRLNVGQLVHLIENRAGLLELGKYAEKSRAQLAEIGDTKGQEAPREIAGQILEAFEREPAAVAALVAWAKTIIPARPVGHSYIAARLLLGVPEGSRGYDVPRLRRVMMNCREHADFAGWWRHEKDASTSRNRTIYQKLALDL